jgi:hypothetical protein
MKLIVAPFRTCFSPQKGRHNNNKLRTLKAFEKQEGYLQWIISELSILVQQSGKEGKQCKSREQCIANWATQSITE